MSVEEVVVKEMYRRERRMRRRMLAMDR